MEMPGGRWKPANAGGLVTESISWGVFIFEDWLVLEVSPLEESPGLLEDGVDGSIEDGIEGFVGRLEEKAVLPDPRILPPLAVFGTEAMDVGFMPNYYCYCYYYDYYYDYYYHHH